MLGLRQLVRGAIKRHHPSSDRSQGGFTIIELLIATLVFSVVLLIITFGVIFFTNSYYRGINSSTTQVTTQSVADIVTQAIQFGPASTTATDGSQGFFCAGSNIIIYSLGVEYLGGTPVNSNWGMYMLPNQLANCAMPSPVPTTGTELLTSRMRLANISLATLPNPSGSGQIWQLALKLAYGDGDLLCSTSKTAPTQGACSGSAPGYAQNGTVSGSDVTCKSQIGSQFCSVSPLTTVAQQRIVNE